MPSPGNKPSTLGNPKWRKFSRRYPLIADAANPELVEAMVQMDSRHWVRAALEPLLSFFHFWAHLLFYIALICSIWGILLWVIIKAILSMAMPGRTVRRASSLVPGIANRILDSKGVFALECSMASVSFTELAASEAAAACLRASYLWSWLLYMVLLVISFSGMLYLIGTVEEIQLTDLWGWIWSFVCLTLLSFSIRDFHLMRRVGLMYDASARDIARHIMFTRQRAVSRVAGGHLAVLTYAGGFVYLASVGLLYAVANALQISHALGWASTLPILLFLWKIFPAGVEEQFVTCCTDGEARYQELVETVAQKNVVDLLQSPPDAQVNQ